LKGRFNIDSASLGHGFAPLRLHVYTGPDPPATAPITSNDSLTHCYFESPDIRAIGRSVSVAS
jgi:hypothetical protein